MSQRENCKFPVNQLIQRYSLVKSGIYKRMKLLGIKPDRIGIRSYITQGHLELLDELHQFIQKKGTLPEFLEQKQLRTVEQSSGEKNPSESPGSHTASTVIVHVLAIESSSLERLECLERAAQKGWHLSTSEIAHLLKISTSVIQEAGDRFSKAGFTFSQAGQRIVGEADWKVSKLD